MAQSVLQGILEEARRAHEIGHIVAVHRTGELDLGAVAVAVLVAAPHRAAAYEASRFVIEAIKAKLPIWKFEAYSDGAAVWQ
jgi:molybdopterin synthase catalytic subunit